MATPLADRSRAKPPCACGGGCPLCSENNATALATHVGSPHDACEREAEHIATNLTSTVPSHAPAGASPSTQSRAANSKTQQPSGGGQQLDVATRNYFEPRLGHDLSGVRVHSGPEAAQSADQLEARAYTSGHDVVFGAGEYAPASTAGRHLLAHELVHVVQQGAVPCRVPAAAYSLRLISAGGEKLLTPENNFTEPTAAPESSNETIPVQRAPRPADSSAGLIQRTAKFVQPTPVAQDPLARLAKGLTPGLTTPELNGTKPKSNDQISAALAPTAVKQTGSSGGNLTCQFDQYNITTSAEEIVSTAAPAGGWTGNVPPAQLGNPPACAKVAQIPVTMNALPNNADFVKRVQASEDEHVADLKELHDRHFVPLDKFINGLTASGPDLQGCANSLVAQLQAANRGVQAAFAFSIGWAAAAKRLDGAVGTHSDNALVKEGKDCSSATITLSQANPRIAGSGVGNVKTIAPTVTTFDPTKLKVVGNDLKEGKTVVKKLTNAADATAALKVIQHYGMTSRNVLGPLEYFLVGKAAPAGVVKAANELAIDPARYQVSLDLPNAGDWAITDVIGSAKGINVNVLANFGANRDQAYSGWALLKSFGFTQQGWVGGTRNKPEMMYFRV